MNNYIDRETYKDKYDCNSWEIESEKDMIDNENWPWNQKHSFLKLDYNQQEKTLFKPPSTLSSPLLFTKNFVIGGHINDISFAQSNVVNFMRDQGAKEKKTITWPQFNSHLQTPEDEVAVFVVDKRNDIVAGAVIVSLVQVPASSIRVMDSLITSTFEPSWAKGKNTG